MEKVPNFENGPEREPGKSIERQPDMRNHYSYHDNNQEGAVIFECFADDVLEADRLYKEAIGNDPNKQPNVGCEIDQPDEVQVKE